MSASGRAWAAAWARGKASEARGRQILLDAPFMSHATRQKVLRAQQAADRLRKFAEHCELPSPEDGLS